MRAKFILAGWQESNILVLFAFLAPACATDDAREFSDRTHASEGAIVFGEVFTGLPAVGALTLNNESHCTGTLIAPKKVLTAAHCLMNEATQTKHAATALRFIIGPSVTSPTQTHTVQELLPHPKFVNVSPWEDDVGIVLLNQPVSVSPMNFVPAVSNSWVGQKLFAVGYGLDENDQSGVKRAAWVKLTEINDHRIRHTIQGPSAGTPALPGTGGGDSGGPLFFSPQHGEYLIAGVTSYGASKSFGVHIRADAYQGFIDSPKAPNPPSENICNGVSSDTGACNGVQHLLCESSDSFFMTRALTKTDCSAQGLTCFEGAPGCCPYIAKCDLNTGELSRCDGGVLSKVTCYAGCANATACVAPSFCNGAENSFVCDSAGTAVVHCDPSGGAIVVQNCAATGRVCNRNIVGCERP